MMLIVLAALAFIASQGAATTIAAHNHSEEVSEALAMPPVPTTLLACHAPYHPLPEPIYDVLPDLEYTKYLPVTVKARAGRLSLNADFSDRRAVSDWWSRYDRLVAFIDYGRAPRKLEKYMGDKEMVQFELPDHNTVDESKDFGIRWGDLMHFPMPHFWQLDLTSQEQMDSAHKNLRLPYKHFERVVLVLCPYSVFLYAPELLGEVPEYIPGMPDPELLRALKVTDKQAAEWQSKLKAVSSFWSNLRSLIAPGGRVVINSLPYTAFGGKACYCGDPSNHLYAYLGSNAPYRSCKHHNRLDTDICWGNDALREPFDHAIALFEAEGFELVGPQFDQGELGIALKRVESQTAFNETASNTDRRKRKRAPSSEEDLSKQRKLH
ncbi:unnamed protein product [Vitrella brassicaformis CCMP3155]|uniref:Uncharacterized protein n=1 Tax=Vitrella brassicaformis (strain CCMP3155) TaxID=1169540 RepID=A0A0G4EAF8_VITBC|nr:unnamed protein product [Vitrella brassicaformis CCMP3155]|eukprot:CEL92590.1 unnamed protein product [Vitrella brassicaformis CCMP3155]